MILTCSFEELRALASGAELVMSGHVTSASGPVVAPAEALTQVELLRPRLNASLSIPTLGQLRGVRSAVALICEELHERLEAKVLEFHPAHEEAVSLYFDYAHAFAVLNRLDDMAAEMGAMIELMTGAPPTRESAAEITFPDE